MRRTSLRPRASDEPDRPSLAPLDALGREIQRVLDLVKPMDCGDVHPSKSTYDGYCGAATEAYLHLAGGRRSGLRVLRRANGGGSSHWWLEGPSGVIDLTLSPANRRYLKAHPRKGYPYEEGRGAMFQSGYDRPSKRARAIVELVESRSTR